MFNLVEYFQARAAHRRFVTLQRRCDAAEIAAMQWQITLEHRERDLARETERAVCGCIKSVQPGDGLGEWPLRKSSREIIDEALARL